MRMEGLSVCITTRNNLEYLKLCLKGLHKYSSMENEVLIHVDGSTDGTVEWLEENAFEFTRSEWTGIYSGWNNAAERAAKPYMILFSDDMFVSPNWDINLLEWCGEDKVIVPRLVEPEPGSYPPPCDCGRGPGSFNESKFIKYAEKISGKELTSQSFGAYCIPTEKFRSVGGFDTRFNPSGVGSLDLALSIATKFRNVKFYEAGDVIFYHFQSKARYKMPNREELESESVRKFAEKWGFGPGQGYACLEAMV